MRELCLKTRKLGNLVILLLVVFSLFAACSLAVEPDINQDEVAGFAPVPDNLLGLDDAEELTKAISYVPLIHKYSNKYVCSNSTANMANVFIYSPIPPGYTSYFRWDFITVPGDINYHYIRHRASGRYLCVADKNNGANVFLYGPVIRGKEDMFKFKIKYSGVSNYYYFQNKYSGKYICTGYRENYGNIHTWGPIPAGHEDRYRFRYY